MTTWIITGGAGFIGANLCHYLCRVRPDVRLVVVDRLTYCANVGAIRPLIDAGRVELVIADVADREAMDDVFVRVLPDGVFHLAAESHVDRSISGPDAFMHANIQGTFVLLECARRRWLEQGRAGRFLHVSTDEVFGDLGPDDPPFDEETPYRPSSPYSASKAASDHLVHAWHHTWGLDAVITNCSNNFGPWQFPEKLIPVIIRNVRDERPLPVYGDGSNVRDWLFVEDHCAALLAAFERGVAGRSYTIGTRNEWRNLDLVHLLCDLVDDHLGRPRTSRSLIRFVTDRPGHDRRYAINPARARQELGWSSAHTFEEAMRLTVSWYLDNLDTAWQAAPEGAAGRTTGAP